LENIIITVVAISLITIALGLSSCSEKQNDLVVSRDFPEEKWERFDEIKAVYKAVKPSVVDVVMEVTVSEDFPSIYPYHKSDNDLPFCMLVTGSDGSRRARDYKYSLKDNDGNWKSEKTDGYYHFQFLLISELNINEIGEYNFNIENKYPKDPLYGVKNVTIRCVPSKK